MECPHLELSVKLQNLRKESTDVTKEWHCAGKCRPSGEVVFVHSQNGTFNFTCFWLEIKCITMYAVCLHINSKLSTFHLMEHDLSVSKACKLN